SRPRRSIRSYKLRRRLGLPGAEPPVEGVALAGHFDEKLRGLEACAVLLLEGLHHLDEALGAEHVDPRERPAGIWRKPEAEYRADVGLAHVGEHALFETARGLERHDAEQAVLDLAHVDVVGVDLDRLQVGEPRPQALLSLLGIIVEAFAVLAPVAAALLDHF